MAKWQGSLPTFHFEWKLTPEQQIGLVTGKTQLELKRFFRKRWQQYGSISATYRDFYRTGYIFWRNELAKVQ